MSETNFICEDLLQLDAVVNSLAIRNMEFDDGDISKIGQRGWLKLDISGNPVNGAGLDLKKTFGLVARDVPLNDQFASAVAGTSLRSLEVANSKLTKDLLANFSNIQYLKIGEGQITHAGILNALAKTNVQSLSLNGSQLTAECLLKMQARPYLLDFSHSGTTDTVLAQLGSLWKSSRSYINRLNLSDTNVTDMQGLNGCTIYYLDISRTKVTFQGIIDLELKNCQSIHVDFNQFTPEELKAIRKRRAVLVGEKFPGAVE